MSASRIRKLAVGVAAGSLLLVGLAATPASAGAWGYVALTSANSGKCLEVGGWAQNNGAAVDQWDCLYDSAGNPDRNQAWYISGSGQIWNVNSGKCLEIGGWAQNNGALADQWDCLDNGSGYPDANQVWQQTNY